MIKYSATLIQYIDPGNYVVVSAFDRSRIDAATLALERMAYKALEGVAWLDTEAGRRIISAAEQAFELYSSGTIKIADCYDIEFWVNR